jgi:hypothetical protein
VKRWPSACPELTYRFDLFPRPRFSKLVKSSFHLITLSPEPRSKIPARPHSSAVQKALRLEPRSHTQKIFSRSHDAVIRVYDVVGNVIEAHEQAGDFKEP